MNILKSLFLALIVFSIQSVALSQEISKEPIAKIPEEIASNLIGIRVYQNTAFVMGSNGQYITIDLTTGDTNSYKLEANNLLDFDVVVGKILYINNEGMLGGHIFPKWSKGPYNSCLVDACDQGLIVSGGANAYFLAKNATTSIELPEMRFCLPIERGFLWSMSCDAEGVWQADLYDCFGNIMSNVYKFSRFFKPSNLELGPHGVEGELLVSAIEDNRRTLSLIGNNGRMFWKIYGPEKVCLRDVAFDQLDRIIVLEKDSEGQVVLTRYTFIIPEG